MTSIQRKQGVGVFNPVSWNKGRRFTAPGPGTATEQDQRCLGSASDTTSFFNSDSPILRLQIEAFLDDHPEFTESYFLRKAKRTFIDKWLSKNSTTLTENTRPVVTINKDNNDLNVEQPRKISEDFTVRKRSGLQGMYRKAPYSADCTPVSKRSQSVTPHRKISAATFEGECHSPLLTTTEDGSVSFLTVPPLLWRSHSMRLKSSRNSTDSPPIPRKKKFSAGELISSKHSKLQQDYTDIPSHIHDNLASDMNPGSLCFKIAKNIASLSKCDSVSVLQVKRIGPKHYLYGSAVDVNPLSIDDGSYEKPNISLSPQLVNCLTSMIDSGKTLSFDKADAEERFKSDVPLLMTEKNTIYSRVTMIPLKDKLNSVQGVTILFSPETGISNLKLVNDMCQMCGIFMRNAAEFQGLGLEVTRSQMFLDLARAIFDQESTVEFTVLKILINFLNLIECERAQILLSSKDSPTTFRKVYDLEEKDLLQPGFDERASPFENRFPINGSITGLVASVGETVNISDISKDSPCSGYEDIEPFSYRSLLCMPIMDSGGKIVGVVSLMNKKHTTCFTDNDENFVEAFNVFCGISLANVTNLEVAKEAEARSQVALEIMSYHASSSEEEAANLAEYPIPSSLHYQLHSFNFTDSELDDIDTMKACLRMFIDLDLMTNFQIHHQTLCRWILTVKKNYRPEVVYHNWRHAFNVAQVMYSSLRNSGWWEGLGPLTCLGLIVACLCHDLDHRGTNNTFQVESNSPLASLYSTSTLERHHLHQALIILNLDGNRIFDNLSPEQYTFVLEVIEEAIIATDLSLHFKHLGRLKELSARGKDGLDWQDPHKCSIVKAALMTASDLGATTKPWHYQQEIAGLVAEEFWTQGDLEREHLKKQPVPMMDRELRHELPSLQMGFCDNVCLPVYVSLSCLSSDLLPLEEAVRHNRDKWAEMAETEQDNVEEEENTVTRNL